MALTISFALLVSLTALACSDESPSSGDDTGLAADTGTDQDSGALDVAEVHDAGNHERGDATADADLANLPPFVIPATSGTYGVDFTIAIDGAGTGLVGAIDVTDGAGTVELDGRTVPVGVYERQDWSDFGYTLYQTVGVDADRWWILWFYCRDDRLTDVFFQGSAGPTLQSVVATGSCEGNASPSSVRVDFPRSNVEVGPLLDTFEVIGPEIEIPAGSPGVLRTSAATYDVWAFGHVDCTESCGADGWHEIHALVRDPTTGDVCFSIFYLYPDMRPTLVSYAFSLPILADPFGGTIQSDVTWIGPL